MYETSPSIISRPRQCVPLACVKYIRNRSSVVLATLAMPVCRRDTLNELTLPASLPTSATQMDSCNSHSVLQTGPSFPCSSSISVASSSCSSSVSSHYTTTNSVRQSVSLRTVPTPTTLQLAQHHAADVSATATPTVGLASAVWTPMGATLQHIPEHRAVTVTPPDWHSEQLRLLGVHFRLTISFNEEFSQHMNTIIQVIDEACTVVMSPVFRYTLDRLRLLRFKYCQLSEISVAYGEYQKHIRSNQSVMLPTVSCLHSSIQIMMDSVNAVTAIFREMHQWMSADARMTVTERGLGLSNRFCHFVPAFVQEMSNFRRSLLMIVPNAVCTQSANDDTGVPNRVSPLLSRTESSAGIIETVPSPLSNTLSPEELYGQGVEPVLVAPMPIVIEPDGQPDDECGLIQVKQEPIETNRKRQRTTHQELIYVDDDDDDDVVSDAVDESNHMACAAVSRQFNADDSLTLASDLSVLSSQHHSDMSPVDSQLTTFQSHGMSCSGAREAVSTPDVHFHSHDVSNSASECFVSDARGEADDVEAVMPGVSRSPVILTCSSTIQSAAAKCTSSQCFNSDLEAHFCPSSSRNLVSAVGTGEGDAGQLSSGMNVSCGSNAVRAFSSNQGLGDGPASDAVIDSGAGDCVHCTELTPSVTGACITDSVTDKTLVTQGSKLNVDTCDELRQTVRNGDRTSEEIDGSLGHSVALAEAPSDWSVSKQFDDCLTSLDLSATCHSSAVNDDGETRGKQTVVAATSDTSSEPATDKVVNAGIADVHNSSTPIEHAKSDTSNGLSDVNNLCTISSVCSIDLEGFDVIDVTEQTPLDDIVTAVHAFDKNANIVFHDIDLCSRDFDSVNSELSHSVSVKTVHKKKKRVTVSRFARRRKRKRQKKALRSTGSKTNTAKSVSDNLEVIEDVHESSSCEKTLHSVHDEDTVDSLSASGEPVHSDKEQFQNIVSECRGKTAEETCQIDATDVTSQLSHASCDATECPESIIEATETDQAENTDSSSEPELQTESCASVSDMAAVVASDIGNSCQEATGLESEKEDSDESHPVDVVGEKCFMQPESECRDEADVLLDDDRVNVPAKKKRARVLYEEEDDDSEVSPVSGKSMQSKTRTAMQTGNAKKLKKFKSSNAKSVSRKLTKKRFVEEKRSKKKVKKQEQCKQKHYQETGKVAVDKPAITEPSRADTAPKYNCNSVGKHKIKKSRKLLKLGVKQKTIRLVNVNKAQNNAISDSSGVTADELVQQRTSHRLSKSQSMVADTKEKALSLSDSATTVASSESIVPSCGNEDQPRQSARDKVNAIFRNSEFTLLHSSTSLVHSRGKPALPASVSSSFKAADGHSYVDDKNHVSPLKNSKISGVDSERDRPKLVVTSECLASTSPAVQGTCKPVTRRPEGDSCSLRTSTSISHSDTSVKVKGGQRNHIETPQMSQKKVGSTKLSSTANLPVVCSRAKHNTVQNSIPSLLSLKVKPCLPKLTTDVSSVSHSITRSQPLNVPSAAALRDPRLAQRQHSVSSEQQPMLGLIEHRHAESIASGKVGTSSAQNCSGTIQWPWEKADNVGIQTTRSTNLGSEGNARNELSSHSRGSAGCWAWESGESTHTSSVHSTLPSVDINNLSTIGSAADYVLSTGERNWRHSATSVVDNGSSPFCTTVKDHRAPDDDASTTLTDAKSATKNRKSIESRKTENRYGVKEGLSVPHVDRLTVCVESHANRSVIPSHHNYGNEGKCSAGTVPNDIMSPGSEHGAQPYVGSCSIPAQHGSAGNDSVSIHSHCSFTTQAAVAGQASAATESLLPHNKGHALRLIPLDCSGILHDPRVGQRQQSVSSEPTNAENLSNKPSSERMSAHTSDPITSEKRLIPLDSSEILRDPRLAQKHDSASSEQQLTFALNEHRDAENLSKKLSSERKRCSGHPSDPRQKATRLVLNGSSLIDKSDVLGSADESNLVGSQPVVADLVSGIQQSVTELDCPQTETSPAAESLDSRIDTFVSHIDTFSVDKNVEDEVDKMMSWWETDLEDAEMCLDNSVGSGDLQLCLKDNDSEIGNFIVIDSDDDDDCNDELVIDLSDSDVEMKPEPSLNQSVDNGSLFTKTISGHPVKYDVARNREQIMSAESKTACIGLSDVQSTAEAKANHHVDNPLGHRRERSLSTRSSSSGTDHHNRSVKHRNGTHAHVKYRASEGHGRVAASESRNEYDADNSQYMAKTTAASQLSNSTSAVKPDCHDSVKLSESNSAAASRQICRNSSEVCATVSTRNAHELPTAFNTAEQDLATSVNKAVANSRRKSYHERQKARCSALATCYDSASTVSTSLACLADVSEPELGKLKSYMEARVKAAEHKITQCNIYACPVNNLDESEKRLLIADRLAESAVLTEFDIELRLQSLQRDIDKTEVAMAKIKSQFDPTRPSMSLEKKYDKSERVCNNLYVRRDWLYMRMNLLHRYHKSKCLLTLPNDLRFSSERRKSMSVEGVPLILNNFTISLHQCTRLAALLKLIKPLCNRRLRPLPRHVLRELGWLHQERKTLLSEICCSSPQKVSDSVESLSEKLTLYWYVTFSTIVCPMWAMEAVE